MYDGYCFDNISDALRLRLKFESGSSVRHRSACDTACSNQRTVRAAEGEESLMEFSLVSTSDLYLDFTNCQQNSKPRGRDLTVPWSHSTPSRNLQGSMQSQSLSHPSRRRQILKLVSSSRIVITGPSVEAERARNREFELSQACSSASVKNPNLQ